MKNFSAFLRPEKYLNDPFLFVKNELLGAYLCSSFGGDFTAGMITEAEVYLGASDKASHSYGMRRTKRTEIQFETGGRSYVFLIYGLYPQLCVTMGKENDPVSVLIRSLEPVAGIEIMKKRRQNVAFNQLTTGPGKLCLAMGICRDHNGLFLDRAPLWISPRQKKIKQAQIASSPRIGVSYAQEDALNPWRFYLKNNLFISQK